MYEEMSTGKLFVISAHSGAGKTSLVNSLIKELASEVPLKKVVTYTTRVPRPGEVEGIDYYFLSTSDFELKIKESFFIEFSTVYGHYYGSPKDILSNMLSGLSYVMIVDQEGALRIKEFVPEARLIWVYVSNMQILSDRLFSRGTDHKDSIKRRLAIAGQELEKSGLLERFDFRLLNDDFAVAISALKEIILSELGWFNKK